MQLGSDPAGSRAPIARLLLVEPGENARRPHGEAQGLSSDNPFTIPVTYTARGTRPAAVTPARPACQLWAAVRDLYRPSRLLPTSHSRAAPPRPGGPPTVLRGHAALGADHRVHHRAPAAAVQHLAHRRRHFGTPIADGSHGSHGVQEQGILPPWLPTGIYVLLLSVASEVLALLAVGLTAAWGAVPRWIPHLGGPTIPAAVPPPSALAH
jgi:hypothetical protein